MSKLIDNCFECGEAIVQFEHIYISMIIIDDKGKKRIYSHFGCAVESSLDWPVRKDKAWTQKHS